MQMRQVTTGKVISSFLLAGLAIAFLLVVTVVTTAQTVCALSDFNCDGEADLLWRNLGRTQSGRNGVWLMKGLTNHTYVELPAEPNLNWELVGSGDFSRTPDTRPDIVWSNRATGANRLWLMNGTIRTATVPLPAEPDLAWQMAGVGDFNRDARPDIVWRNRTTGANRLWLMRGSTRIATLDLPSESDLSWHLVGVGDINGDGLPDLTWRKEAGDLRVWLLDNAQLVDTLTLPTLADQNWQIQCVRDLNRDGRAEILWRNLSSGENAAWYLEGQQVRATAHMPAVGPLVPVDRPVSSGLASGATTQGSNMLWFFD